MATTTVKCTYFSPWEMIGTPGSKFLTITKNNASNPGAKEKIADMVMNG